MYKIEALLDDVVVQTRTYSSLLAMNMTYCALVDTDIVDEKLDAKYNRVKAYREDGSLIIDKRLSRQ